MKMRLNILLFCLALMLPGVAQTYDALWQEVDKARAADLPKTALTALAKIEAKAAAEGNDAQLMSALLVGGACRYDIAPDSGRIALQGMEAAAQRETRPVVSAMWHAALGTLGVQGYARYLLRSPEERQHVAEHFRAAIAAFEALEKTPAAPWQPLLRLYEGNEAFYADDLLGAVGYACINTYSLPQAERRTWAHRIATHYEAGGNRNAALLATLDSMRLDDEATDAGFLAVAEQYADLPLNVKTYVVWMDCPSMTEQVFYPEARKALKRYGRSPEAAPLRRYVEQTERPTAHLRLSSALLYPGEAVEAALHGRNVRKVSLRIHRLALTAAELQQTEQSHQTLKKKTTGKAQLFSCTLPDTPPYEVRKDTLRLRLDAPGVYLCELLADGKVHSHSVIHISAVRPLQVSQPDGSVLLRLVDAESGTPLRDGVLTTYDRDMRRLRRVEAAADGSFRLPVGEERIFRYFVTTKTDTYAPEFSRLHTWQTRYRTDDNATHLQLFTDRAIYRPGQQVQVGGVLFTQQGDDLRTENRKEVKLALLDVNRKTVDSLTVSTDEFGTVGATLAIPQYCLPGYFSVEARSGGALASHYFRVEEYKRPTFSVENEKITDAYALGDTVAVSALAKTYSGLPVAGAKVNWTVRREMWMRMSDEPYSLTGTAVTDADGRFSIDVPLLIPEKERGERTYCRYFFHVNYDVTAENGETVTGSATLHAANRAAWYDVAWAASVVKEHLPQVVIHRRNAAGNDLGGKVAYRLEADGRTVCADSCESGKAFVPSMLNNLPSGTYNIIIGAEGGDAEAETVKQSFLLFSEKDTKPSGSATLWQHIRTSDSGDEAFMMVGSPEQNVTLFYELFTAERVLESRVIHFSDSLLHFPLCYQPAYGDGATARFVFVKNGKLFDVSAEIRKPMPDKRLTLSWQTFRSRLEPGQQEQWRLSVKKPDGTPANAAVMVRLYDAALDAFAKDAWGFTFFFPRRLGINRTELLTNPGRQYMVFKESMVKTRPQASGFDGMAYDTAEMTSNTLATAASMKKASVRGAGTSLEYGGNAPRTNFAETAFFHPALRTDSTGSVNIDFTLPESLTSWNFNALAHSAAMDFGILDTMIVARKDFMVQAALPRFLRSGDNAELPATLRNLTKETVQGIIRCTLTDAQSGKTVLSLAENFSLLPDGAQTFTFPFVATTDFPMLVCRITAEGKDFGDGEEHYLPVFSDLVSISRSIPFSMTEKGTRTFALDTLLAGNATHRNLTVELTSHALWQIVAALPQLAETSGESATAWASRYYSLCIADYLARTNPDLRRAITQLPDTVTDNLITNHFAELAEASPWLREAENEKTRAKALKTLFDTDMTAARMASALDRLRALRNDNGAWSWYKGMPSNAYITMEVATLLARTASLTGDKRTADELQQAFAFLQSRVAEEVKDMKETERKLKKELAPSEFQLRYLYLRSLMKMKPDADAKFLMDRAEKQTGGLTMYEKALNAVVLAKAGREAAAQRNIRSLLEHTVSNAEMGRWFDTDRAQISWQSYRIPTQTAAVEALSLLGDEKALSEMRLWLMQTKRTQLWETSRATSDALYALLATTADTKTLADEQSLWFTLRSGKEIIGFNSPDNASATGFVSMNFDDKTAESLWKKPRKAALDVRKNNDGLSWGSVTASYTVPAAEVKNEGRGLTLVRRFEVMREGKWQPLAADVAVSVGDRVRQVFTLTSDRDYDFVSLCSARPACLEPVRPLSGYTWQNGLSCYRVVRDASNEYFFEKMPKGSREFEEEFFISHAGSFQSGIAELRSVYAPEFSGTASGAMLRVE